MKVHLSCTCILGDGGGLLREADTLDRGREVSRLCRHVNGLRCVRRKVNLGWEEEMRN